MSSERVPPQPPAIVLVLGGPLAQGDIPELCEHVRGVLEGGDAQLVVCDVAALDPDAVAVDALARLRLTARRLGRQLELRDACSELQELLAFAGLNDVVPLCFGFTARAEEADRRGGTGARCRGRS